MPNHSNGPLPRSKAARRVPSGIPNHSHLHGTEPTLDRSVQGHIGRKLQSFYDGLIGEPVPARFEELLTRLEANDDPRRSRA